VLTISLSLMVARKELSGMLQSILFRGLWYR
jgi:hypothetical protein